MKVDTKITPASAGGMPKPPQSYDEARELIHTARARHDKPINLRATARSLVCENRSVIEMLRANGDRQEDAVFMLLELSGDAHKPDTLRKAIASVIGSWATDPNMTPMKPADVAGSQNPIPATPLNPSVEEEDFL